MYTRAGDKGLTALIGGELVSKSNLRVATYGTFDELNSVIGLVRAQREPDRALDEALEHIQRNLFTIGSLVANPAHANVGRTLNFDAPGETQSLESTIDAYDKNLSPLTGFILPGGTKMAALLHVARTVTRRAERLYVALSESETVDVEIISYLNRLSSALFVFARHVNEIHKVKETPW